MVLINFIKSILGSESGANQVTVTTFHKWTYKFLKEKGYWNDYSVAADNNEIDQIIEVSLSNLREKFPKVKILQKSVEFYKDEFSWLKGKQILEFKNYADAKRTGRGTTDRVTAEDKKLIWELYVAYCDYLISNKKLDFDDFANIVFQYIENDTEFSPPFSHIVIDEAQDLSVAQLKVMKSLVSKETNSLTIIADAAQRIYKSGFTWAEVGLNVRGGRSVELKKNYRNTKQIAQAAVSLLSHDPQQGDFTEQVVPERNGVKPKVILGLTFQSQAEELLSVINSLDLQQESMVILHRTHRGLRSLSDYLGKKGCSVNIIAKNSEYDFRTGLFACTMSSVKGLEFDYVFLCDLNDDVVPYLVSSADDNDDLQISTERRLLYTCMTRARNELWLATSTDNPCRFLDEIDASLLVYDKP